MTDVEAMQILLERTPPGTRIAYVRNGVVVIPGVVHDDPDHNCDEMGCPSVGEHIVERARIGERTAVVGELSDARRALEAVKPLITHLGAQRCRCDYRVPSSVPCTSCQARAWLKEPTAEPPHPMPKQCIELGHGTGSGTFCGECTPHLDAYARLDAAQARAAKHQKDCKQALAERDQARAALTAETVARLQERSAELESLQVLLESESSAWETSGNTAAERKGACDALSAVAELVRSRRHVVGSALAAAEGHA